LVLQARAGDREALEQLLLNVQGRLLAYVTGVVGRTAADDVLQEVLLQIYRQLKWLREPELFIPWTYRIASRASFKFLKRVRRLPMAEEESRPLEDLGQILQPELKFFCELPELLERLSPRSRAVLHLHYLQDLPLNDIAAILEIGVGTVKSRLAYGLSCLREIVIRKEKV